MKKINIKLSIFITTLILLFIIFIYFFFKSYNYEKKYIINEFTIVEKYNKKNKYYTFQVKYKNVVYPYIIENKYFKKRKLINDIEISKNDKELCILPISKKIDFYPLCSSDGNIYSYNLANTDISYKYVKYKKINKEYENIKINALVDNSFLLYNYKGFYLINNNYTKNIELFDKDIYKLDLVYQIDNYLIVPDYSSEYYINKIFVINMLNGKVKEIDSEVDISYNSIFLGSYKNCVYLLDQKEEKEYKINIRKEKIGIIDYVMLKENKLIKVKYNKIKKFRVYSLYNYKIINNYLYQEIDKINIKLSNNEIKKIIKNDNGTVYYLSEDNLYMFNNQYGEVLLINNFEWYFNNTNTIYIYK